MRSFAEFNFVPTLMTTLSEKGLTTPTPIQMKAMPILLKGKSVVGVAKTGTGKTLAYVLPILQLLKAMEIEGEKVTVAGTPRAAVILPTRDLGEQVARVFKVFTHGTRLRVRSVLGGTDKEIAKKNVSGVFDVVVATPDRLVKLMGQKRISLNEVRTLIFDEADMMLDPTFLETAKKIAKSCHADSQLGMFSATVSPAVQSLIYLLFSEAEIIQPKMTTSPFSPNLTRRNVFVKNGYRFPFLQAELEKKVKGGTLLFVNTREQVDEVAKELRKAGRDCLVYRGEMDKLERRRNLKAFRDKKCDLLVSTDLASRGLDVDHVTRIINYHLPKNFENYIHRVGRTARAGRQGLVVNLVTHRDRRLMEAVERVKN